MPTHQLEHQEITNDQRKFPITVICDNITSPENVGMIFRIAEAMGVEQIYLCGNTLSPIHKKVQKTSRSTQKNVSYNVQHSTHDVVLNLKAKGYTIAALELTNNSQTLSTIDFRTFEKVAIILGNEQHGVDHTVLNAADLSLAIQMYGKNTSINVVNSLSITLYEITRQLT